MHQQRGDGSCQQAMAWRLGGEPDIGRLVSALEALSRLMPELDVRYDFDESKAYASCAVMRRSTR